MGWIAWVKGLCARAEVLSIAGQLHVDPKIVAACCMILWEWADDETEDGLVTNVTLEALLCHADAVTGVQGFGVAFAEAGWMVAEENGVRFPNWDRYNGATAKARMKAAARQATWRNKRDKNNADTVISALPPDPTRPDRTLTITGPVPEFTSEPGAGPDRRGRAFVQTFTLRVSEAFGWTADVGLAQSKAVGAIGRRLLKRADRDQLSDRIVAAAREKASDAALRKPVAAWQKAVDRMLGP